MTCIVAYSHGGRVHIGGDSAGVAGYSLVQRADEKVFANGDYVFGFTTSFRMGQLLRYRFAPPRCHPGDDLTRFMSTDFVDAVRKCLKDYGFANIKEGVERGGRFIVGVGDQIFQIHHDFQVGRSIHPYDACGCGEDLALGALAVLSKDAEKDGDEVVRRALAVAETFSGGVRGPFNLVASAPFPERAANVA